MEVIKARNVNDAYAQGLNMLYLRGVEEPSRNGPVIVAPWPVTTVYANSRERVLFSPIRDANPFFHLMESLWMLAGRNDVAFPAFFANNIKQYSDNGSTLHGAYGFRWREHFGFDQLSAIVLELRKNPASRRCVLQMWDCSSACEPVSGMEGADDWMKAVSGGKDVPCNTHAYVDARGGILNLTVCCRSNDIVWGCYGANAVHFSVLQEVLAAAVGVPVGIYRQISNNFHIYTEIFKKEQFPDMAKNARDNNYYAAVAVSATYVDTFSIVGDYGQWLHELKSFLSEPLQAGSNYKEAFFRHIAAPMYAAWNTRKQKGGTGMVEAQQIAALDWRRACMEWIMRREARRTAQRDTRPEVQGAGS